MRLVLHYRDKVITNISKHEQKFKGKYTSKHVSGFFIYLLTSECEQINLHCRVLGYII